MRFRKRVFWCRCLLVLITGIALAMALPGSAAASKIKFTPLKRHGKKINFNKSLPGNYRKKYYKLQGSATDGRYIYSIYWNKYKNKCVILKINAGTKKKVKSSPPLNIDHGNDVTYNPHTRLLYVVDNTKKPFTVSIVDPGTLKVCGIADVHLPLTLDGIPPEEIPNIRKIVGITYDGTRHQYALRVSGLNDFIITDESFVPLRYVKVSNTFPLRQQTLECDQNHVYVCMDKIWHYNLIVAYNWDGIFQYSIRIPLKYELQSIYHIGRDYYATFYDRTKGHPKSFIYKFRMP